VKTHSTSSHTREDDTRNNDRLDSEADGEVGAGKRKETGVSFASTVNLPSRCLDSREDDNKDLKRSERDVEQDGDPGRESDA
jgi:hypothetical protein